jgi:hypothetical protein
MQLSKWLKEVADDTLDILGGLDPAQVIAKSIERRAALMALMNEQERMRQLTEAAMAGQGEEEEDEDAPAPQVKQPQPQRLPNNGQQQPAPRLPNNSNGQQPPRKPGRPPGSKNKPKLQGPVVPQPPQADDEEDEQ